MKTKLTNDQLSELLPFHQTGKLSSGWFAEVHYDHKMVKVGTQTKPQHKYFRTIEHESERDARQVVYDYMKQKGLLKPNE